MLLVYIASRIYAIDPPGDDNALDLYAAGGHDAFREEEEKLAKEQPKISPLFCFCLLVALVVIIGFTAEWLVESIEYVRESGGISEE
jgi:Ca2+:H+ antiporter